MPDKAGETTAATVAVQRSRSRRWAIALFAMMAWSAVLPEHTSAEEPAERFLKQLRAAGYFDMAVAYLDRLDSYPGVPSALLQAIELEKGQTHIAAALAAREREDRDEAFSKAAASLKKFVNSGDHPRISEARLLLGTIQMSRAQQLLIGETSQSARESARQSYLDAAETFDSIIKNLREKLKSMRGQRVDRNEEPEKVAQRDAYRNDFLNALLNSGNARYLAATTYEDPANEGKQLLEKALNTFSQLNDDYGKFVQGANALAYLGKVHQALGDDPKAIDSFLRMLEQQDAPPIRESKFEAAAGLAEVYLREQPPNYRTAIERGQALLDSVRPDEKNLPAVQHLRVSLAKAYLARAADKDGATAAEIRTAKTNSRRLLTAANKVAGEHTGETKELLATIGIDQIEVKLPEATEPKSLQDASDSSRQLFDRLSELEQSLELLQSETDPSPDFAKQIEEVKQQIGQVRATTAFILRRGVAMINQNSDRETARQARQRLAFVLYEQGRYWDAAVVGGFIARHNPGTDVGLDYGLLALRSLRLLVSESGDELGAALLPQIQKLGMFLSETWPNDPDAAAARGVMVQLALSQDRGDEADRLVAAMPDGPEKAHFRRMLGLRAWNESLAARQEGDEQTAERRLGNAIENLQAGLEGLPEDGANAAALQAALVLSKAKLRQGHASDALQILRQPKYGPQTKMSEVKGLPQNFAADVYGTELRALVAAMTEADGEVAAELSRAEKAMEKLRQSVTGPDAESRLLGTMVGLARDIREQIDAAPPRQQQQLLAAFRLFVDRVAESSKDPATLTWVGSTLLDMGESLIDSTDPAAQQRAKELVSSAAKAFERLLAQEGKDNLTARYQLGRSYRLLGEYKSALDELETVLRQKPNMLDAQIEAATAYERWAASLSPKYKGRAYQAALTGGRPDEDGKNVVWGWGKISQLTSRDPKFRPIFFDARYHVALCRFLQGRATKENKVMEKAISDVTAVAALYPEMGGPDQRRKFDRLLRQIQQEVGRDPVGLQSDS